MQLPIAIQLGVPIKAYGDNVTSLTFARRPNLGDLRATDGRGEMERVVILVSRLTGIPESSAEQIDVGDLEAVSKVIEGFFGGHGQETGTN
jgi:hypothetical protein